MGVFKVLYKKNKIIITLSPTKKGITLSFSQGKKFENKYNLLEGLGNKTLNLLIMFRFQDILLTVLLHQG